MGSTAVSESRGGERGAVAIIVAISMFMIIGLAALAIDLGNAWQERRHVINGTDAGALAAAGVYSDSADSSDGCAIAPDFVLANSDADPDSITCEMSGDGVRGLVTVSASTPLDYVFAPVLGIDDTTVHSATTVRWGPAENSASGMRPFAMCIDFLEANGLAGWNRIDPLGPLPVPYGEGETVCGDAPGNWGLVDFDGGANPTGDIRDWIRGGYDDDVFWGTRGEPLFADVDEACDAEDFACYNGDPGVFPTGSLDGSLDSLLEEALEDLVIEAEIFRIPIFDHLDKQGSNATFHLVGELRVQLVSFDASGPSESRELVLMIVPGAVDGGCCTDPDGGGTDFGGRALQICAVDDTDKCTDPDPEETPTPDD